MVYIEHARSPWLALQAPVVVWKMGSFSDGLTVLD
jgi:hypothetical protein